jgi:hypothetical protein
MKKTGVLVASFLLTVLIAGGYSILHDQITYTISHEYYTKFKFVQFGLAEEDQALDLAEPRQAVAIVGFMATWWTGVVIGLVLGLVGLTFPTAGSMFQAIMRATGIILLVTILAGIVGGFYGKYYLARYGVDWWLPEHLVHKGDFITVGSIHNFSYLGGLVGLVAGIIYLNRRKRRQIIENIL